MSGNTMKINILINKVNLMCKVTVLDIAANSTNEENVMNTKTEENAIVANLEDDMKTEAEKTIETMEELTADINRFRKTVDEVNVKLEKVEKEMQANVVKTQAAVASIMNWGR